MEEQSSNGLRLPVVLGVGPDTAYYNIRPTDRDFQPVRQELDEELQEELEALKHKAQEQDELIPTRWVFEGQSLSMRDKGGSQFKWILENDFITLSVGRGKKTGIIGRVRLSSEYLWGCDADLGTAMVKVDLFLRQFYQRQYITLDQSGLDLAADVLFLDMSALDIKEGFISRAVLDDERPVHIDDGYVDGPSSIRRRWKKIAGLSFGMHTSVTSAVIYNKTHEIKYHSKEKGWFHDLWRRKAQELGIDYTEDMMVWRVEVRFTRTAFREFPDVSAAYDVLDHVRDLWTYAVGHPGGGEDGLPDGWLRYVMPTTDTNRARWPVHPAWEVIQHAFDPKPLPESEYEREEREKQELLAEVDAYLEEHPFASPSSVARCSHQRSSATSASPSAVSEKSVDLKPFIRKRKRQVNMERGIAQVAGWVALDD